MICFSAEMASQLLVRNCDESCRCIIGDNWQTKKWHTRVFVSLPVVLSRKPVIH